MVSFSCEVCNDTVIKKKLDQHTQRCYGAYFTCIDCSITFQGIEYRQHTSCISEAEKYEKALYKGPKKNNQSNKNVAKQDKNKQKNDTAAPKEKSSKEVKKTESKTQAKEAAKGFDLSKHLKNNVGENLYKVVKKVAKENSKDTKDVLKNMKISRNGAGEYTLTF